MKIENWENGVLKSTETLPDPPKSADETKLEELRAKILAQTATAVEVQEFLSLKIKRGDL